MADPPVIRLIAVLAVFFVTPLQAQNTHDEARWIIQRFVEAHNSHALDEVMALFADDAVFYLSMDRGPVQGRQAIRDLERFDIAAQSTIYPQGLMFERDGDLWRVHITGAIEHSEVFEAAGLSIVMAQPTQNAFVLKDGTITVLNQAELRPDCFAVASTALQETAAWLEQTKHRFSEKLVRAGRLYLTPETIPQVIRVIREWRAATGWTPDRAAVSACAGFAP